MAIITPVATNPAMLKPGWDLHANQSDKILSICIAMISLAIVSVILRFVSRKITRVPLWWDDWLILVALIFTLATSGIITYGAKIDNYGTHVALTAKPERLHSFLRGLWSLQITYTLALGLSKLAMLCLYWRVFPGHNMRIPLFITAGLTIGWTLGTIFAGIFSCIPVQAFWTFEMTEKRCVNSEVFFITCASINIFTDIIVLALPLPIIHKLQISFSQKVAVSGIFMLGVFTTICSGMRLRALSIAVEIGFDVDPTWDLVGTGIWCSIETAVSVVCACLPSMRPLLRLVLHGKTGSSRGRQYGKSSRTLSSTGNRTNRQSNVRHSIPFGIHGKADQMLDLEDRELQLQPTSVSGSGITARSEDEISCDAKGLVRGAGEFAGVGIPSASPLDRTISMKDDEVWVTQGFKVESSERMDEKEIEAAHNRAAATAWRDGSSISSAESVRGRSIDGDAVPGRQSAASVARPWVLSTLGRLNRGVKDPEPEGGK